MTVCSECFISIKSINWFRNISSCWNRHFCVQTHNILQAKAGFKVNKSRKKKKKITNTRQGPDTAVFDREKKKKSQIKSNARIQYITLESWNKSPTKMFAFLCSHIRAVNATCLETPVTASRQKQNHSFTAMPGARMTDEKKKKEKRKNIRHFPPNLELLRTLGQSTEEWMES